MQSGKEEARPGMSDATIVPSVENVDGADAAGVRKVEDRWLRIGVSRSSSSRRGRPRAVNSRAFARRFSNSWTTMLICSLPGTYAIPPFRKTLRCWMSSGTIIQSTLNHPASQTSFSLLYLFTEHASNLSFSSSFSDSSIVSQLRFKEFVKARRSRWSSLFQRSWKSCDSTRTNRWRNVSVEANARRRIKWE